MPLPRKSSPQTLFDGQLVFSIEEEWTPVEGGQTYATGSILSFDMAQFVATGELPPVERPLLLRVGDTLIIHADHRPGEPAREDADDLVIEPAHISCQQPEVFEYLSPGEPISGTETLTASRL